jgi:hypothetical protein
MITDGPVTAFLRGQMFGYGKLWIVPRLVSALMSVS